MRLLGILLLLLTITLTPSLLAKADHTTTWVNYPTPILGTGSETYYLLSPGGRVIKVEDYQFSNKTLVKRRKYGTTNPGTKDALED